MGIRRIARLLLATTLLGGAVAHATEPITLVEVISSIPGLSGTSDVVVSPDGAHVYVTSPYDDTLVMFSRDAGTNALTSLGFLQDGVGGVDGLDQAMRIAVSPDGAQVYVASQGDSALAVFDRDAGTGLLTQTQVLEQGVSGVDGLTAPTSLVVAPDGGHVYGGRVRTEVPERGPAVFERDAGTGLLTFVEVTAAMPSFSMTLSPDGANLYAAGALVELVVATRDANTGLLTPVQTIPREGGLGSFTTGSLAVSPDGRHLYYSGTSFFTTPFLDRDFAIATFVRDTGNGTLLLEGVRRAGLGADISLRVTSDGLVLVMGSPQFGSGGAGARNPATGAATRWDTLQPVGGRIAIAPDDRGIYGADEGGVFVGTLGPCRPLVIDTKLSFKYIGSDPDPDNDTLVLKGKASLPGVAVPDLALDVTGVRLVLDTLGVGPVSDDTIPGGTYGGTGTAGWVQKNEGAIWLYLDRTLSPINGITKITIQDRSSNFPGEVGIKVIAKAGGSYPVPGGTFNVPTTVARLELGSPDTCLLTGTALCKGNAALTKSTCKTDR